MVQQLVWDGFSILHQTRTIGFSAPNAISLVEARTMAQLVGYVDEYEYVQLIVKLDLFWQSLDRERRGQGK